MSTRRFLWSTTIFAIVIFVWVIVLAGTTQVESTPQIRNESQTQSQLRQKREEEIKPLIVMVSSKFADGSDKFGAGIIFSESNNRLYIITANHVVRDKLEKARVRVKFYWLPGETFPATITDDVDSESDLTTLIVEIQSKLVIPQNVLRFDQLGDPGRLRKGDSVYLIGNPHGESWRINVTPDAVFDRRDSGISFESTHIAEGHSGGALLNEKMEVVGMITEAEPPNGRAVNIENALGSVAKWNYAVNLVRKLPPKPSLESTKIAFEGTALSDSRSLIYLIDVDGKNLTPLPGTWPGDVEPKWSPDGTKIALIYDTQIYLVNTAGGNRRRLTNNQRMCDEPTWSPDGNFIAYTSIDRYWSGPPSPLDKQIEVIGVNDTTKQRRITQGPGRREEPSWSPDGTKIAFMEEHAIYVMNVDGSSRTRVSSDYKDCHYPSWSPDGSKIAFTAKINDLARGLYLVSSGGDNPRALLSDPNGTCGNPSWSPDGTKIVYSGWNGFYMIDADGTNNVKLSITDAWTTTGHPAWSPFLR